MTTYTCRFCGSERKNLNSKTNHERLCKQNPNRDKTPSEYREKTHNQFTKAKENGLEIPRIWNKGVVTPGKPHTEETKKKISQTRKSLFEQGKVSGRNRISHYRENPDKDTYLYVAVFRKNDMAFTKVGISEKGFEDRYKTGYEEYQKDCIYERQMNGLEAAKLEREILRRFKKTHNFPPKLVGKAFIGRTECLTESAKGDILDYIKG